MKVYSTIEMESSKMYNVVVSRTNPYFFPGDTNTCLHRFIILF